MYTLSRNLNRDLNLKMMEEKTVFLSGERLNEIGFDCG